MPVNPRITIITPSYNQGRYIRDTVESILSQRYPNLEYIIMDGGSTDDTLNILANYPELKVISETDQGQWDAINKGFNLATGDIWGYINSDDTLLSGALERVAQEIDPALGRHVVMGRCKFIDQEGNPIGYEHPSGFKDHISVLKIWNGHSIPQPAVFWTPEVWRTCGGMEGKLNSVWLDYDLFCRFSRCYQFHFIDQVLATYRLHLESKTFAKTEQERLEESIRISKRYWGPKWSPKYIRLTMFLLWFRFNPFGKAQRLHARANDLRSNKKVVIPLMYDGLAALFAPRAFFFRGIFPTLWKLLNHGRWNILDTLLINREIPPQTAAFLEYDRPWSDSWCGPHVKLVPVGDGKLNKFTLRLEFDLRYINGSMPIKISSGNTETEAFDVSKSGQIDKIIELPKNNNGCIVVDAEKWYIPHRFFGNGDYRPLSWRLISFG